MSNPKQEPNIRLPIEQQTNKIVDSVNEELATIEANPDLANHPNLQAAVATLKTSNGNLAQTVENLGKTDDQARALRVKRDAQVGEVKRDHDAVVAQINQVCAGDKTAMATYGGTPRTRKAAAPSTEAPTKFGATNGKVEGDVDAACKAEKNAVCYLFQCGTDPAHPESWPPPVISPGCKHTFHDQAPGTKLYVRAAIQRRRTGQGKWSDIVAVTAR
jgi:hypothetical protein